MSRNVIRVTRGGLTVPDAAAAAECTNCLGLLMWLRENVDKQSKGRRNSHRTH